MTADREVKNPPAPKPGPERQGLSAEERRRRLGGWAKWFEPRTPFPLNEELVQKYVQQLRELEAARLPKKRPRRRAALREALPSFDGNSGSARRAEAGQEPTPPGEREPGTGGAQP